MQTETNHARCVLLGTTRRLLCDSHNAQSQVAKHIPTALQPEVASSADGRNGISASYDKTLRVWPLTTARDLPPGTPAAVVSGQSGTSEVRRGLREVARSWAQE